MKNAELVTFGGSGLDRAGDLRLDAAKTGALLAEKSARAVVFWRGKPLISRERPAALVRLPMDHPIFDDVVGDMIVLGREDGAARFAFDLSSWSPSDVDTAALGSFLDPTEQRHPMLEEGLVFAELRRVMTWLSPRGFRKADGSVSATAARPRTFLGQTPWSSC